VSYTSLEYQDILKDKTIRALKEDPVYYVSILPKRFFRMVIAHEIKWDFLPIDSRFNFHESFKKQYPEGGITEYLQFLAKEPTQLLWRIIPQLYGKILLLFAIFGVILAWREHQKILLLLSLPVYLFAVHLAIYWEARFFIPGDFPLLIFSAVFLSWMFSPSFQIFLKNWRQRIVHIKNA